MAKVATKTALRDADGRPYGVKVRFVDGREVEVHFSDLGPEIKDEAMTHGLLQKLGDSYAGVKGDLDLAFANADAVVDSLRAGEWNRRGTAGAGGVLAEAIARLTGRDVAEVAAMLAEKDDEERKLIRKDPRVDAAVKEIQAERARAKARDDAPSLDSLLG